MQSNSNPKFIIVDSKMNINESSIKTKVTNAEVVFHGNKLVKNTSSKFNDRPGTLVARYEIDNIKRRYAKSEFEEISCQEEVTN